MRKLKVSGVAKGQYKQLCPISWKKCNKSESDLNHKIRRAVDLGKKTHTYSNGCRIIRYHHLNFLVDKKEIMTMWKDKTRNPYNVSERRKSEYNKRFANENTGKISIERPLRRNLSETGFNKNIKIKSKQTAETLLNYDFTNYHESSLYYSRDLGSDISFNLSVNEQTLEVTRIDVLDENFLQPYDYQRILCDYNNHEFAREIYFKVDSILGKLQCDGIITGYEDGMYV